MPRPWYSRVADWLRRYNDTFDEKTPVLLVATPLVKDGPAVKPLAIVVPLGAVSGAANMPVRKTCKNAAAKRKMKARKR